MTAVFDDRSIEKIKEVVRLVLRESRNGAPGSRPPKTISYTGVIGKVVEGPITGLCRGQPGRGKIKVYRLDLEGEDLEPFLDEAGDEVLLDVRNLSAAVGEGAWVYCDHDRFGTLWLVHVRPTLRRVYDRDVRFASNTNCEGGSGEGGSEAAAESGDESCKMEIGCRVHYVYGLSDEEASSLELEMACPTSESGSASGSQSGGSASTSESLSGSASTSDAGCDVAFEGEDYAWKDLIKFTKVNDVLTDVYDAGDCSVDGKAVDIWVPCACEPVTVDLIEGECCEDSGSGGSA